MQDADQSLSNSGDLADDAASTLFPPFLTPSGNLRIPSSLPLFPARIRGEAEESESRQSDGDEDWQGDSSAVTLGAAVFPVLAPSHAH